MQHFERTAKVISQLEAASLAAQQINGQAPSQLTTVVPDAHPALKGNTQARRTHLCVCYGGCDGQGGQNRNQGAGRHHFHADGQGGSSTDESATKMQQVCVPVWKRGQTTSQKRTSLGVRWSQMYEQ